MNMRVRAGQVWLWICMMVGAGSLWAVYELPFVNWKRFIPPVDERPMQIRQDAKGDGQYLAPRSGHRRHRGIDLAAPLGSSVRAMQSGTVIDVGRDRGLGRFIELAHPGHLTSLYAHLATVDVTAGERVKQGAVIGTVGKTGNARHRWIQPHLHFEVSRNGQLIDPATLGLEAVVLSPTRENPDGRGGD